MQEKINQILKSKKFFWSVMVLVFALGIFFRIYHFHDWLHFGNDQARDAFLVEDVVKNNAPWPLLGSSMGNTGFLLGPMYYYFQIISVKIFGTGPDKLAYPDLVFNLLSIPLLYFFLKRYFDKNLALALTGLYSLSYYTVEYSRFAWNPNPIPFFVILFLMSLWEFLIAEEKTKWHWIFLLGISLGVGSQLHAILLLTMLGVLGLVFIFLMKKNWRTWSRWMVIFLIAVVANTGQIVHEQQTNYANSKVFLASFGDKSDSGGSKRFFRNLQLNVACNAQANTLISTALSNKENCDFLYSKARNMKAGSKLQLPDDPLQLLGILASLLFSFFGYATLAYRNWKIAEKKQKYFTGIILLYAAVSFGVMLPIIDLAPMRYFIHTTFLPFVFIGLLIEHLLRKYPQKYFFPVILTFVFFAFFNLLAIYSEALALENKTRADSGYLVLDEAQLLADFMVSVAAEQKTAYLFGGTRYFSPYNKTLVYLTAQQGLNLNRGQDIKSLPAGTISFYVGSSLDKNSVQEIGGMKFFNHLNVGQVGIYQLQ